MNTAGIRFGNDIYINVTIEDGNITLYTVDGEGNKEDYTVTKANRRRTKKDTEE